MILILGASGYIGKAFSEELHRRGWPFAPLSHQALDYSSFGELLGFVQQLKPDLVINAAGFSGHPNVDACEADRLTTFEINTKLPQTVSRVCVLCGIPMAQVSSGSMFSGAKVFQAGAMKLRRDLGNADTLQLFAEHPERFFGFTEYDEPNFTFRHPPANSHAGTRALAEEALRGMPRTYIWRFLMPFDEIDSPCNLLSKLMLYPKVFDHITSLSHLGDSVAACLDLVEKRAAYGIYNVVNPGAITTGALARRIRDELGISKELEFYRDELDFNASAARVPRSCCILDSSKLLRAGVLMRPLSEAIAHSLSHWRSPAETCFAEAPAPTSAPFEGGVPALRAAHTGRQSIGRRSGAPSDSPVSR